MNEFTKDFIKWLLSDKGKRAIKKVGMNPEELPEVLSNIFGVDNYS
jgi:hypothetical protein